MSQKYGVQPHNDPWINLPEPYVATLLQALSGRGIHVPHAWMDPSDPRDATILFQPAGEPVQALVWDEETGLRTGRFLAGRQGVRTEVDQARYLGGGLLPAPHDAIDRIVTGVSQERAVYRSRHDVRDGFDDLLRDL